MLRAIGDPAERFTEDKLRILRAVRIATRFDLAIDPATLAAAQRMATEIRVVSAERIAEELRKLLVAPEPRPRRAAAARARAGRAGPAGAGADVRPQGCRRRPARSGTTSSRAWRRAGRAGASFPLAFAALLHDVGKPRCSAGRGPVHVPRHEHVGADGRAIADRLRLSNAEKARVAWLVEKHQYLADAPTMRPSKLKPILVHPGIGELLALHRADALASGRSLEHVEFCERMLRETPPEELNPPPVLTGDDLIALGLKPGPEFKRLLDAVREAQLEGRVRTKEEALAARADTAVRRPAPAPETPPA